MPSAFSGCPHWGSVPHSCYLLLSARAMVCAIARASVPEDGRDSQYASTATLKAQTSIYVRNAPHMGATIPPIIPP